MIKEGLKKLQEKKFCDALSIFNELIKLNPNDGDVLFTLGNIYYELNDLKKVLFILKDLLIYSQILKS